MKSPLLGRRSPSIAHPAGCNAEASARKESELSDDVFLIVEEKPLPGDWNMAADEFLLEQTIETGQISVRIYRWEEATLSLGHFQKWPDGDLDLGLRDLPVVRRLSGGGAIVHDQELTYSLQVPSTHFLAQDPAQMYDLVHAAIIDWLAAKGINVQPRGAMEHEKESNFLCYARGDWRDLMIGNEKIVGSAQRRRKGAILQHGSILLSKSSVSKFRGVLDFHPERFQINQDLCQELGLVISALLGKNTHCIQWETAIMETIRRLARNYRTQSSI